MLFVFNLHYLVVYLSTIEKRTKSELKVFAKDETLVGWSVG